ncbi:hypothetical protein [Streptomyces sp. NPDC003996]
MVDEDEILARALGQVGAAGGALGGGYGGGLGGRLGSWFTARFLKTESQEAELTLHLPLSAAAERVQDVLTEMRHPIIQNSLKVMSGQKRITAIAGGGVSNLNPVVITVKLTASGGRSTALKIRTAAKEGLIKQRSAAKAMKKFVGLLGTTDVTS